MRLIEGRLRISESMNILALEEDSVSIYTQLNRDLHKPAVLKVSRGNAAPHPQ